MVLSRVMRSLNPKGFGPPDLAQAHPWFARDLPPGMADMNARLLADPAAYRSPATQARCCTLLRII